MYYSPLSTLSLSVVFFLLTHLCLWLLSYKYYYTQVVYWRALKVICNCSLDPEYLFFHTCQIFRNNLHNIKNIKNVNFITHNNYNMLKTRKCLWKFLQHNSSGHWQTNINSMIDLWHAWYNVRTISTAPHSSPILNFVGNSYNTTNINLTTLLP